MTTNIPTTNFCANYSYNPRKKVNKAGAIGAGVGLIAGAGLQYGGGELLKKNADKILLNGVEAVTSGKKGLTKVYKYLAECLTSASHQGTALKKAGIAGVIGATIIGLASALKTAKKQLP